MHSKKADCWTLRMIIGSAIYLYLSGLLASELRWWIVALPFAWSLIGGTAAFLLHVPQDWLLLASGVLTVALRASARRKSA
jgi:hypothetical protein